jgi:hypothetical protein
LTGELTLEVRSPLEVVAAAQWLPRIFWALVAIANAVVFFG